LLILAEEPATRQRWAQKFMQPELSRKARRALDALHRLAGDSNTIAASWAQIADAAGMGRTAISEAMRELAYAGKVIALDKEAGVACRYKLIGCGTQETAEAKLSHKMPECSDPTTTTGDEGHPSIPVRTSPHQSGLVRTGSLYDEVRTDDEFDDDERAQKKSNSPITALLGEYGLAPPFRDILAREIATAITRKVMTLDDARAICARTQKEAQAWRQPKRVLFMRLRARAAGELQDPLPLILDMPSEGAAAQGAKTVRGYQKRQSQKTMDERIKAANDW
jgi:DNA-binding transcriptional ArsR family regulator